ncbi:protoheme IX farnesyltransferase, mitochondrial [Solanum lycopersicum]|uniref:Heme O synthase n=1 Tax=Solanum lycopersicum TaxID=4081 RepID=A0A3Q7F1S6_SOLLC|nr:protoheme IX farnesyltransferase, mitochondrial [Solanum lycopersicum]
MWRNSVGFSSKLLTSKSSCSRLPLLNHGVASRSTSTAAGSGPESTEAAGTVKVGFSSTEWVRTGSPTSSAVDLSSFAAASVLKGRDIVDMAKHYGRCYAELSKARLSMLVVATSGTGYILGSGSAIDYMGLCCTCAGTMMVAASASTLNQVFEVKNDAKMNRTKKRPLPSGRISIPHAVTWAASIGILGTGLLASKANMLAAGLGASNLVLYAFVYTPLKQIHPINTWVGAIVGAIPPLLGWAAASGQVSLNGMLLPAALYFWQIPHFMALAYLCRKDYADGGFRMYSLADASGQRTASVAFRNCLYLLPLGYLAYDWSLTSGWFCLESTLLALAISGTAISFYLNRTTKDARRMFHASLLYLPVFMSGLLVHRVTESEQQMTIEHMSKIIELSPSLETAEAAQEEKRKQSIGNGQRRPPVAYASVAPFPFLPAPSYATF